MMCMYVCVYIRITQAKENGFFKVEEAKAGTVTHGAHPRRLQDIGQDFRVEIDINFSEGQETALLFPVVHFPVVHFPVLVLPKHKVRMPKTDSGQRKRAGHGRHGKGR